MHSSLPSQPSSLTPPAFILDKDSKDRRKPLQAVNPHLNISKPEPNGHLLSIFNHEPSGGLKPNQTYGQSGDVSRGVRYVGDGDVRRSAEGDIRRGDIGRSGSGDIRRSGSGSDDNRRVGFEGQHGVAPGVPFFQPTKTKRDRMFELELSNQSHSILLLRNDLNNKDIEIVELKGQLQDFRIKMERLLKEKDKQLRERNTANASLREDLEAKMQMISTLQKEVGLYEARNHQPNAVQLDNRDIKHIKEKEHEWARLLQEKDAMVAKKNFELQSLQQKLAEQELRFIEQEKRAPISKAREKGDTNLELEGALRQAKSRTTTLEAELAVSKAESGNAKALLVESEKAVSMLKEKNKAIEYQLREMDAIAHEVRRQQDLQVELSAVHAEKVKLRSLLDQKSAVAAKQESEISALSEQIAIYQEDFRVKSDLVDNQDIRLRQRESEIESLKGEVMTLKVARTEALSNIKNLEAMLADKAKDITRLSELLHTASKDGLAHKTRADATAAAREDLLAANTENTRLNILLQQANVDLTLQKQQMETLEQQVSQLASRPTAMANHMEELEQLVDQQSSTLAGLHDAIAQRDALIAFFEQETGHKDKTIEDYDQEIEAKEGRIRELEEALRKATLAPTKIPPTKNVAHLEAHIRDLQAEQVRYRAEIQAYREDIRALKLQLQADPRRGAVRGGAAVSEVELGELQEEAAAVAAELTSLCVLVKQAGRDSTAFSALRESEIGKDLFHVGQEQTGDGTLSGSLATIKRESDALRAAVTTFYAESVGSDCAVQ